MNLLSDTEVNAQEKEEMETKNREGWRKEEEIRRTLKKMKNKKAGIHGIYKWNPDGSVEICGKYIIKGHDGIMGTSLETRRDRRLEAKYYAII